MTIQEITDTRSELMTWLEQHRLSAVFGRVRELTTEHNLWSLQEELDSLSTSYGLLSQYYIQGIDDPERTQVYAHITDALYTLVERVCMSILGGVSREVFFERRSELGPVDLSALMTRYATELHKITLLESVEESQRNPEAISQARRQSESIETSMFNKVWSSFPLSQGDAELLHSFCTDPDNPEYARALMVMSLFLGLTKYYDERKLLLLGQIYPSTDSAVVQTRCVVSLLLMMKLHINRVRSSSKVSSMLSSLAELPNFASDVAAAAFLLIRTRNTDNISRRVRDEVLPDLFKMTPELRRKLRDRGGSLESLDLEENPEWREMLENDSFTRKMETFQQMQLEGNDVFIDTFSRLKSFPFFYTLSNWFLPFHHTHSVVETSLGSPNSPLGEMISHAPFLCNSDRFSFCLSLGAMPEQQRQAMQQQVGAHIEENREALSIDPTTANERYHREALTNRVVQDLYRFFKLFSRRREFAPVMDMDMDFTDLPGLEAFTRSSEILATIARFYMDNDFDTDALRYYELLCSTSDSVDPIVQQRIGFIYERAGDPRQAIVHYQRYELSDENSQWNLRHIAACFRALHDYDRALDYYRRAAGLHPDNVSVTLSIGHCLLEAGRPDEALQQYFKADLLDESRHRAWRPTAWCLFLTGNMDRALEYYNRLVDNDMATAEDYLNRGHVLLCLGNRSDAVASYRQSASRYGSARDFAAAFRADSAQLTPHGFSDIDLAIIADAALQTD